VKRAVKKSAARGKVRRVAKKAKKAGAARKAKPTAKRGKVKRAVAKAKSKQPARKAVKLVAAPVAPAVQAPAPTVPSPAPRTALNPAAAWPFPSGSRP
jgi:hypothetical protein